MSTLANAFQKQSSSTAIILPKRPAIRISYSDLTNQVLSFQQKLADLGIGHGSAVSIALANSYEFIVSFLASSWQRGYVGVRYIVPGQKISHIRKNLGTWHG